LIYPFELCVGQLKILLTLLNLLYRLLKQLCKEEEKNSHIMFKYLPIIRQQLGKGIQVTATLKELFFNKRSLLQTIDADIVDQFVRLLHQDKEPQYIDFLMSVCTIGPGTSREPIIKVQSIITEVLLARKENASLLPSVEMNELSDGNFKMKISIAGFKDSQGKDDLWIDCAHFKTQKEVRGKKQDYAGWILNAPLALLTREEKVKLRTLLSITLFDCSHNTHFE